MVAPWNVRVTPRTLSAAPLVPLPDFFAVEVRIRGRWLDAGTAPTWLEAFLMGLVA